MFKKCFIFQSSVAPAAVRSSIIGRRRTDGWSSRPVCSSTSTTSCAEWWWGGRAYGIRKRAPFFSARHLPILPPGAAVFRRRPELPPSPPSSSQHRNQPIFTLNTTRQKKEKIPNNIVLLCVLFLVSDERQKQFFKNSFWMWDKYNDIVRGHCQN